MRHELLEPAGFQEGDIVEAFELVEERRTLER